MNQKISWSHSVFRSVRLATDFHRTRFGNRRLQVLSLMVNHLLQIETDLDFDCSPSSNKLEFLLVLVFIFVPAVMFLFCFVLVLIIFLVGTADFRSALGCFQLLMFLVLT